MQPNKTLSDSSDNLPDQETESEWKTRQIISRRISNSPPSTTDRAGKSNQNLWKLGYRGVLSILRAEAFRTRAKSEQIQTSDETDMSKGR